MNVRRLYLAVVILFLVFSVVFVLSYSDNALGQASAPVGMVLIPGGTFQMGCFPGDSECAANERPRHQVTISRFYMDEHEVTVDEYAQCVSADLCGNPSSGNKQFNWNKSRRDKHPINGVDWINADKYCQWQGKRLPTEAEFEYLLRNGRDGGIYPWDNSSIPPGNYGNYADESVKRRYPEATDDGYVGTSPVCSFSRDQFGLCDISGNVFEWCADWDGNNYYSTSPARDPQGPSYCNAVTVVTVFRDESGRDVSKSTDVIEYRVVRGGSWFSNARALRASCRNWPTPGDRSLNVGFRCSRDSE
ncbi:MAG: formylglycine-generating enzyme family protein [Candidatus Alcyoniella australis]|nr:formylglycine-generating enzyme family protein [Candidatus Alcyoniella australis]